MNLKIHNVSLSIKGRLIVNDVSITVNPGEVVGLMGPNGCLLYTSDAADDP